MKKPDIPLIEAFGQRPDRFRLLLTGAEQAGIVSASKVLEIGCACGEAAAFVAETYACEVTGIDISADLVIRAREKKNIARGCVEFLTANAEDLPFPNDSYSLVFSEAAFSLLPNKERSVSEYHRILKDQGKVIINDFIIKNRIPTDIQDKMEFIPCFHGVKSSEEYIEIFCRKGFHKLSFKDYSGEIIKTSVWLSKVYGIAPKELSQLFIKLLAPDLSDSCEWSHNSKTFFKEAQLGYGQFIFQKIS